jgi:hypothetical protein
VRVVDDFAGEKHTLIGKSLARLIRVVHGPVDAIAESKLACEVNRQPS